MIEAWVLEAPVYSRVFGTSSVEASICSSSVTAMDFEDPCAAVISGKASALLQKERDDPESAWSQPKL